MSQIWKIRHMCFWNLSISFVFSKHLNEIFKNSWIIFWISWLSLTGKEMLFNSKKNKECTKSEPMAALFLNTLSSQLWVMHVEACKKCIVYYLFMSTLMTWHQETFPTVPYSQSLSPDCSLTDFSIARQ